MKIEDVKKPRERVKRSVSINLRINEYVSRWLKENDLSPTLIFDKAIEELMEQKPPKKNLKVIKKPDDY